MSKLLPVLMGFALLLLSSTKGWSLPPCPDSPLERNLTLRWDNCFGIEYYTQSGNRIPQLQRKF